jgi:hypothetical protein
MGDIGQLSPFALSPSAKLRTGLSKGLVAWQQGFDRLSPNGEGVMDA